MQINQLTGEQRRQLIDTQQVYGAWRESEAERLRRFSGSMRWAERKGSEYLLRKTGRRETSLGPRSPETEAAMRAFHEGREANREKLAGLSERLDQMARVNQAMGLGRLPVIAARIARRADERGLLGRKLFVVGTNALLAYEVLAGVQVESGLLATGDMDLLMDGRQRLSLAFGEGLRESGLIGLLKQVDRSFSLPRGRHFRASNKDGYLVDLIRPPERDVLLPSKEDGLSDLPADMAGAGIIGLEWLISAPKLESVVIDGRGYPAPLTVVDPRVFALHKAWLAQRPDRDPVKAERDRLQAAAAALIARDYLRLSFDAPELSALPAELRSERAGLLASASVASMEDDAGGGESPRW